MYRLFAEHGEAVYHLPEIAVRQEWFHERKGGERDCSLMYDLLASGSTLLDWGSGTAESERRQWIDQARPTILMDLEGPNLCYVRAKYARYPVTVRSIAQTLPRQYDALLCLDVLEHIPNPMTALNELWANLKPGGYAAFWFEETYPYPGHLQASIAQRPEYEAWLYSHTTIIRRNWLDIVQKPRRWWQV